MKSVALTLVLFTSMLFSATCTREDDSVEQELAEVRAKLSAVEDTLEDLEIYLSDPGPTGFWNSYVFRNANKPLWIALEDATFAITSGAVWSADGIDFNVYGSGFEANEAISLTVPGDAYSVVIGSAVSNADGEFQITLALDAADYHAGTHYPIFAHGDRGSFASTVLVIFGQG